MHPLEATFHVFSLETTLMLSLLLVLPSWALIVMLMLMPVLIPLVILTLIPRNYVFDPLLNTRLWYLCDKQGVVRPSPPPCTAITNIFAHEEIEAQSPSGVFPRSQ